MVNKNFESTNSKSLFFSVPAFLIFVLSNKNDQNATLHQLGGIYQNDPCIINLVLCGSDSTLLPQGNKGIPATPEENNIGSG